MCQYHEADLGNFIHISLGHHDVCGHISCEPLLGKPPKDSLVRSTPGCSHGDSIDLGLCGGAWTWIWNVHVDDGLHLQFLSSTLMGLDDSHQVAVPVKNFKFIGARSSRGGCYVGTPRRDQPGSPLFFAAKFSCWDVMGYGGAQFGHF